MSRTLSDDVVRTLTDLLGFAREVHEFVVIPGEQNFHGHRPTQLVAEALIHRIGEAVGRLPDDFVAAHPKVSWRQMERMRNIVAHEYGYIDYRIVWRALDQSLPQDVIAIEVILEEHHQNPDTR